MSPQGGAGAQQEQQEQGYIRALLLAWFASQHRSLFAAKCLVETVTEMYREGYTLDDVKLSLSLAGGHSPAAGRHHRQKRHSYKNSSSSSNSTDRARQPAWGHNWVVLRGHQHRNIAHPCWPPPGAGCAVRLASFQRQAHSQLPRAPACGDTMSSYQAFKLPTSSPSPAGFAYGGKLLSPLHEDLLLSWVALVMMTLKTVGVPPYPRVGVRPGAWGEVGFCLALTMM